MHFYSSCRSYAAFALLPLALLLFSSTGWAQSQNCSEIERRLPPVGMEIPEKAAQAWRKRLSVLKKQASKLQEHQADVGVLLKACDFAIQFRELYKKTDAKKVDRLLALANTRIQQARAGQSPWKLPNSLEVRGFQSKVDDSYQPVGLVFGEGVAQEIARDKKVPLYVWLHGRGDKNTDLHFICDRLDKTGQINPPGAIVLHPFGRQCVGYKSAGETDVMEAIDFVCQSYPIDRSRIVLMGFSMGGAGVWHLAAHYGERFVSASPGAGFAETAQYQRLTPDKYPPKYEQVLWRVYDVPGYVRNLFNLPLVAYSGEKDKQIQAARVMEQSFASEGRRLPHLIGPGMGHKYHAETLKEILARMNLAVESGKPSEPAEFFLQSPHLRYAQRHWLTVDGVKTQFGDTRVDAKQSGEKWKIATKNVTRLRIEGGHNVSIDGEDVQLKEGLNHLSYRAGVWAPGRRLPSVAQATRTEWAH